MSRELKAWEKQFESNFGPRELLRFLGILAGWELLGFVLSIVTGSVALFYPFLITAVVFPFVCRKWKPAYWLLLWIVGNKGLPPEPKPRGTDWSRTQDRPWWSFLSGIWFWILAVTLLYLVILYFVR